MPSLQYPSAQIELALAQSDRIEMLEFSLYDSRDDVEDRRKVFRIERDELRIWWERAARALGEHEEIGLNSRVQLAGESALFHLPMIDLKGSDPRDLDRLWQFIGAECPDVQSMHWFSSGRSFHGYGSGLLDDAQWRHFMGTLLLFRAEGATVGVDTRWVGHRLRGGFACLRLTRNTSAYVKRPAPLPESDSSRRFAVQ